MIWNKFKATVATALVLGLGAAGMAYQDTKKVEVRDRFAPPSSTTVAVEKKLITSPPVNLARPDGFPAGGGGGFTASLADVMEEYKDRGNGPETKQIRDALEARVALHFANPATLADLVRHIQESTKSPKFPNGIPIYVDPIGLQDVDKTMESTVQIELEGVPLKTTLALALKQLNLRFEVKDDLLLIDSDSDNEGPKPTMLSFLFQKAQGGELTREQYQELIELLKLRNEVRKLYMGPMGGGQGGMAVPMGGPGAPGGMGGGFQ